MLFIIVIVVVVLLFLLLIIIIIIIIFIRARQYKTEQTGSVSWLSGRTSVSDRRTFAVLRSTCG